MDQNDSPEDIQSEEKAEISPETLNSTYDSASAFKFLSLRVKAAERYLQDPEFLMGMRLINREGKPVDL